MKRLRLMKLARSIRAKIVLALAAALLFSAGAWALSASDNETGNTDQSGGASASEDQAETGPAPDLNPPTEAQKKYTDDYKKSLSQPSPPPTITPSGKKQVYPVVTSVSSSKVYAYVEGVIEDGGTCTATATKDSQTFTGTSNAFTDGRQTNCTPIDIALSPGIWSVVVSYSSASYEGSSQAQSWEVK